MERNVFLTLTHYNIDNGVGPWYISNGGNTGIGNMLFQISSTYIYAVMNNAKLYVPGLDTFFRRENLNKYDTIFRYVNNELIPEYITVRNNFTQKPENDYIIDCEFVNNMNFHGYFENFNNFLNHRELILNLFRPTQIDIDYINTKYPVILNDNVCSIHIRLGPDYKIIYNGSNRLYELQECYFNSIDHMIETKSIKTFFVFTNDREYCINILNNNPKYKDIQFVYSDERDYVDIWLISRIKNNIVSVSTLAWWGSYLNEHHDQYIICNKGNRDDLHHPGWVVI
jgi:hypothetical protein